MFLISFLYASALAPKMAWIPLPTSTTPAAPKDFNWSLFTFALSLTSTLNLVMQASTLTIFSSPPKAAKTAGAFSTISLFFPAFLLPDFSLISAWGIPAFSW